MNPAALTIRIEGIDQAAATLQEVRNVIADRRQLHAELAENATEFTRQYLIGTPRHHTASRLGAAPTNFRARNARALQADSDESGGIIRIPRSTGLGQAFGDLEYGPRNGRKYLTIPDHRATYGRVVRDFAEGTFDFAILHAHRPFPVLVFAGDGPGWKKGEVGYWLRTRVRKAQDRTLLPSDDAIRELARRVITAHIARRIYQS